MYITTEADYTIAAGVPDVDVNSGGGVELVVEVCKIYMYAADFRKILEAYPPAMLVNFVRHNCPFRIEGDTIIPEV